MSHQAGKGDKPRPVNKTNYNSNYEAIDWKKRSTDPKQGIKVKSKTVYKY